MSITGISVTGANASSYTFANNCGTSLAAGASCSIHGHFSPTAGGVLTAAITITDNAAPSPQTITLTGTGAGGQPMLTLSTGSVTFGAVATGTTSVSHSVTLTDPGPVPVSIGSIAVTGANSTSFQFTNNCGTSLASGASCTIQGAFSPTAAGAMTAAITITDNASGSPQSVQLSGTGTSDIYAAFTQNWITEFNAVVNTSVLSYVGPVTDSTGWVNYTVVDQQGNNSVAVHVPSASSRLDVVFIGDSITYLLPFYQKLPELATANASISGQTCAQMAARFATDVVALNPKAVVIACGTNDSYLASLTTSEQSISSMVAQARSASIEVIVATAPPVTSAHPTLAPFVRQLNSYIRSTYVNVWERWYPLVDGTDGFGVTSYYLSDGIHPAVAPAPDMMIGGNLRWALSNADGGNVK
jgi:hypothetical protein